MISSLLGLSVLAVAGVHASDPKLYQRATYATPTAPAASGASSAPAATITIGPSSVPTPGSVPEDYSPSGLEQLWDFVGNVTAPPFTTTYEPSLPIPVPSAPPPLYPAWYAPQPAQIFPNLKLPEGFIFGVATSAYQVEGAVKNEGKGPTAWDWASRQPNFIEDGTNADIADLQYYLYKEDVARAAAMGVTAHSFSISWARIYPYGVAGSPVNQQGIDHYSDLIDYHLSMGVDPVVTLFHWDTPLAVNAYYGGFTNERIVDDYVNYAKTVFKAYNGRVQTWYTFNEPSVHCGWVAQYPFNVSLAPGVNSSTAPYHCAYYLLKAHAGAVQAFREMNISGSIAYKNNDLVGMPWRANNPEDIAAVERHASFGIGLYANPVYTNGDWPPIVKETLPESWLPRFTEAEMQLINGSADFFAIDAYASQYIAAPPEGITACQANMSDPAYPACNSVMLYAYAPGYSGLVGRPDIVANDTFMALAGTNSTVDEVTLSEVRKRQSTANATDDAGYGEFDPGLSVTGYPDMGWAVGPSPDPASNAWLQATPQMLRYYLGEIYRRWPAPWIYISEFGMAEPYENLRTEMWQITEDPTTTNYFMTNLGEALLAIYEDGIPLRGTFSWGMIDNAEWNYGLEPKFGLQHVNYTTLERTYKRSMFALSEFFAAHLVPTGGAGNATS
ncbi:glycoside hydrolase family 1 protein [Coniophora puteana RWD-64-598 SS2]|uniref:Glycoside hydrolase family 1 protein n=1 Tax=Coniophora puteana (strain RWD-64-598) TaxID=741705 RepID=A0A5M3N161_CONPW|nr:glycoside hydrolase family 1 protein [Coniophora puteana RWD-64-598 SS2]EIW84621.1 glycoside hydrolase family 1 protein [Coniophora puteana RWD-64-598 SS2]